LMELAEKFSLPIITLIDTPGAYPGIGLNLVIKVKPLPIIYW